MLKEACHMYGGDFLSDLSTEDWVLLEGVRYKNQYTEALRTVCSWLIEHEAYEEAIRICTPACDLYPFDEWQSVRVECYIGLKRYKDAMKEYENTAKLFFEELGITPSEKMLEQFDTMSSQMNHKPQEIKSIETSLKEQEEQLGAYYCSLPSFRDNYRFVSRLIERNGQSAYLMLCSITDGKGQPMENEEKLKVMSQNLYESVKHCLRRGDSFTQYSPSQFLALLMGTDKENCRIVYNRISKYFRREHKSWGQYLEFYVSSVAEVEREDSKIQFDKSESAW